MAKKVKRKARPKTKRKVAAKKVRGVVELTEYGPVMVCKGEHKGSVGYYDDDADEDINVAIVYLGIPFESKYALIRRSWLKKTAATPMALEKWKRENPELAKQMGVP